MVYTRSKQPVSLEQAMSLRSRLSDLERRYLVAAAEQRDGGDSIDTLLSQGTIGVAAPEGSIAALAAPNSDNPLAVQFASLPRESDLQMAARLSQAELGTERGLGLLRDMGVKANEVPKPAEGMAGLLGYHPNLRDQSITGGMRNLDQALLGSCPANTSLISASFAAGNDTFRNIQALSAQRQAQHVEFPALSSQSALSDFHTHLRDLDQQQQQLASLSNSNAGSTLAAMQLRERTMAARFSQATGGFPLPAQSFQTDVQPSITSSGLGGNRQHTLPTAGGRGFPTGNTGNDASSWNPIVQHSLDLDRFVLQAPQDDATYFRQRLLPGVSSLPIPLAGANNRGATARQSLTSQDLVNLQLQMSLNAGGLSELFKRRLQENELQEARAFKRQR
jgi:hypothetical protein